jgi:integrase
VYKLSTGQWKVAITIQTLDGSSKRIVRNATSQRHGLLILDELRAENKNLADSPQSVSVSELAEKYLVSFEGEKSTLDGYNILLKHHINPHLGSRLISSLTPLDVQEWVSTLRAIPTGSTTVQKAYTLMRRVSDWGVSIRLLPHNPCSGIKRPSAKRKPIRPFTIEEVKLILEATKGDRLNAMYVLAATTGMRQGELFGLQWQDIDLERLEIRISRQVKDYRGSVIIKEPKTAAGIRTISITETTAAALSARRILAEKEKHDSEQVFSSARGMLIRRTQFGKRTWKPLLEKLGLEHRGAHHLRHTAATQMLVAGVPPHIVAGVLGHETAESVMKTYAHFITKDSRVASAAMDRIFDN